MIIKKRGRPIEVYRLEALHRRIPPHHAMKEMVFSDYKKARTGIRGEKEIDFSLKFLDEQDYLILQHLRLPDQNGAFQIDHLILTKKYILILELKNWYGTVIFGENGQVIRIGDNGIEEGCPNPIPQAKLQQPRLRKWLNSHGLPNIPIHFFIVISFPSTIIKSASDQHPIPAQVIHNNQLFFEIPKLDKMYQNSILRSSNLLELGQQLKAAHTPSTQNLLDKYGIELGELMKGIFCPNCNTVPMFRRKQKWYCRACQHASSEAHFSALNDYQWLVGDYITNREAREFLRVDSPDVVRRILTHAGFNHIGANKGRTYRLEIR